MDVPDSQAGALSVPLNVSAWVGLPLRTPVSAGCSLKSTMKQHAVLFLGGAPVEFSRKTV